MAERNYDHRFEANKSVWGDAIHTARLIQFRQQGCPEGRALPRSELRQARAGVHLLNYPIACKIGVFSEIPSRAKI